MRLARFALLICGAALFIGLVAHIGLTTVWSLFARLSWFLPLIVVFPYSLTTSLDALGWRFAFRRDRVPFLALLSARLAGEAFSLTTPTASVGGEAVKAWLVRPYVPLTESLPSVIVAKTTSAIGQALFLLLGLLLGWMILPPGSLLLRAMQWLLVFELIGVAGFVAVQVLGVLGGGGRVLARFGGLGAQTGAQALGRMDGALSHFYRKEPQRLVLSVGCQVLSWTLGALEAYIILWALGTPVSLATALLIEAFGSGVGFAAFLVPARLGALEAGQVAVFVALGLGAPAGLTCALAGRLREAVWAGIGFLSLTTLRATPPAPVGAALEAEG